MEESDADLIQSYLEGHETSLEVLIKRHERVAYSFAYKILQNESDTLDVVQESFVKVWKNIKKFKSENQFRTWLLSIVHNTSIDCLRKRKHSITFSSFEDSGEENSFSDSIVDIAPLQDEIFSQIETKKDLERLLSRVSEDRRVIILMHIVDELSFEEISLIVGKSMNTIKSQYRRALQSIRDGNAPK